MEVFQICGLHGGKGISVSAVWDDPHAMSER